MALGTPELGDHINSGFHILSASLISLSTGFVYFLALSEGSPNYEWTVHNDAKTPGMSVRDRYRGVNFFIENPTPSLPVQRRILAEAELDQRSSLVKLLANGG